MRFIVAILIFLFVSVLSLSASGTEDQDDPPPADEDAWTYREIMKTGQRGIWTFEWHHYWKEGLRIDSPDKNFTLKINLSIFLDGGYTSADEELDTAFPKLEGPALDFERMRVSGFGTVYDWATFKIDIDFADVQDIKDNWFQFTKLPFIDHFTVGHMKEPISLEGWASSKAATFMTRALPTDAFWTGRNIGIRRHALEMDGRLTWAVGAFLNTGSFSKVGDARDRISDANGWNLTGRITYLLWYEDEGRRLLHLGLSYSHLFRDSLETETPSQLWARPETLITDERLVDTGKFFSDGADIINPQFAMVTGPLSFQGEYYHFFNKAKVLGDPKFWGFYFYGSYFLTGEHRNYGKRSGTFFRLQPKQNFRPRQGGWGALELGARFSFIDLNDGAIRGGKEANFTAGLNWYFTRNTRFMFNYVRAYIKDRRTPPAVDSGHAHIFQARFQIEF
jgi:phosphate-selective porin OprO/OprP